MITLPKQFLNIDNHVFDIKQEVVTKRLDYSSLRKDMDYEL